MAFRANTSPERSLVWQYPHSPLRQREGGRRNAVSLQGLQDRVLCLRRDGPHLIPDVHRELTLFRAGVLPHHDSLCLRRLLSECKERCHRRAAARNCLLHRVTEGFLPGGQHQVNLPRDQQAKQPVLPLPSTWLMPYPAKIFHTVPG